MSRAKTKSELTAELEAVRKRIVELEGLAIRAEGSTGAESLGEQHFRFIFDIMFEGVQIIGFDWRYRYLNAAAERHNRRPNRELLGRLYMEIWPGVESTHIFAMLKRCMEERLPCQMENHVVFPDGGQAWFELIVQPVPEGIFILSIDITERKRAEASLLESQARLNGIVESAMDGIITIDSDQKIVLFNVTSEKMFGVPMAEALGRPLDRFIPERFREVHRRHIRAYGETGVTTRVMGLGTVFGLRANGEEFPIEASISQIEIGGDKFYTVILRDITERKQAEENLRRSEENFARAFDSNPAALAVTRLVDGRFIRVNESYVDIMGYASEEVLGRSVAELNIYVDPDERGQLLQILQNQGRLHDYELSVRSKQGDVRRLLVSMEPILYNDEDSILSTFIDITGRKYMEDELRRSNAELEQFAYVASHDLQEPLRAVAGMVQLLQQKYKGRLDERADEYIFHAVEAANRMQTLINDLLVYSRVERRRRTFEAVRVEDCVRAALANLEVAIQESGAKVTWDSLPVVLADATQFSQLFQNLIGNSLKFRGEREPQIHIRAIKLNDAWEFSVRDNGIGIEPQYFERIFLVFQRLHTRREYPGTGIGLALCKKIVEGHGGRIWVESESGQGSTFHFTLPVRSFYEQPQRPALD